MKVTRIAYSKNLNPGKFAALQAQAEKLGRVRSEVWQRYGSITGVKLSDRQIRDAWLKSGRLFDVTATAWKETLRDAKADIAMTVEAAKVKARRVIRRQAWDDAERRQLLTQLKNDHFVDNRYLARLMRKYWKRGHNHTHNQIIVRSDNYTVFQWGGRAWLKIPGLERGKRIAIPLNTRLVHK